MSANPPKIDTVVDHKIDEKIEAAQLVPVESLDTAANKASKTTAEEDLESAGKRVASVLKTAGQRFINAIWEVVQGIIALMVTAAIIYCDVKGIKTENLGKAFVLIIAIYFVRMNHTKTGGVGGTDSR
jgi:hypothetical protein